MTGKELVTTAIQGKKVQRIPWVPFVGCHGGSLVGLSATEYLQSEKNIIAGVTEAIKQYNPDGLPVIFDLQIEAEALGCKLQWADENPPAVISHPLTEGKQLKDLHVPKPTEGRIPIGINAAKQLRKMYPDLALYGLITGPFTLALHLLGTELFMKMFDNDNELFDLMKFCQDVCIAMSDYYIDAGCDIIAVVDPMTSQIGPEQFKQFVTPAASTVFSHIKSKGKLGSFFVCGQAQQNIEVMCECGPNNVSVDENIPLDYVRDICLKHNISFGGNLQLTVVLLMGTTQECQLNAIDCMDIGGDTGFILAPGCDLPFATPPENLKAVTELVHDPYQQDVIRTITTTDKDEDILDMSEYGKSDKIIVDIITLDSESCAPCQYSVEAVKKAVEIFEGVVTWREHKIKYRESVRFMNSLMVKNIPTICIDGHITFVSRIPPKEELIAAIQKRIYEKLKYKIRTQKGTIFILGKTEQECQQLHPHVELAIHELGADVTIQHVTDEEKILSYGIHTTPAVVVAEYKLKSEGSIPSVAIIKEWIKDIG